MKNLHIIIFILNSVQSMSNMNTNTQKEKENHQEKKMRYLEKIINVSRRDKIENDTVMARVGTAPELHNVQKQQVKWFGLVERLPPDIMPQKTFNAKNCRK